MKKVLLIAFLLTINQVMKSQTTNQSIAFSGTTSSYASFGNINELNGVNQFSFEAWVYINAWNVNSYVFSKTAATLPAQNRIDIQLGQLSTKRLYFHVANNGNTLKKREFVNMVFDTNLYYEKGIYRTPTMMKVFSGNSLVMKDKGVLIYEKKRDDLTIIPSSGTDYNRTPYTDLDIF
ncbi:hypothetical protein D3C85_791940 [compost metagenome]